MGKICLGSMFFYAIFFLPSQSLINQEICSGIDSVIFKGVSMKQTCVIFPGHAASGKT